MLYVCKTAQLSGSSYKEIKAAAWLVYHAEQKRSPRREAYIRCPYFNKEKIFVSSFWQHLKQKTPADQERRMRLLNCAVEHLGRTTIAPETIVETKLPRVLLHRFYGKTKDGRLFAVQVKEDKRTRRKDFMSVFPINKLPQTKKTSR